MILSGPEGSSGTDIGGRLGWVLGYSTALQAELRGFDSHPVHHATRTEVCNKTPACERFGTREWEHLAVPRLVP